MKVLRIDPLLQAGVVLLDLVAMNRIGREIMDQEEGEVRIQIKQRAAQKSIYLQNVTVREIPLVVSSEGSQAYFPTVEGIDKTEAVEPTGGN